MCDTKHNYVTLELTPTRITELRQMATGTCELLFVGKYVIIILYNNIFNINVFNLPFRLAFIVPGNIILFQKWLKHFLIIIMVHYYF